MSKPILFLMPFQTNRFSLSQAYCDTFCLKNVKLEENCRRQWQLPQTVATDCSAYSPAAELDSTQSLAVNLYSHKHFTAWTTTAGNKKHPKEQAVLTSPNSLFLFQTTHWYMQYKFLYGHTVNCNFEPDLAEN